MKEEEKKEKKSYFLFYPCQCHGLGGITTARRKHCLTGQGRVIGTCRRKLEYWYQVKKNACWVTKPTDVFYSAGDISSSLKSIFDVLKEQE